jgi:hypothetical protein
MMEYISLWALPALSNREGAKRYITHAEKILGRPLTDQERAYLENVIEQGNRVERWLRELGYFDSTPRGELLRRKGIVAKDDDEARRILAELEGEGRI